MRVFVAGAAGAIGMRLVPQLVGHGHQVTATTRSQHKAERLRDLGAEPKIVDGLDGGAVAEAVRQAEPDVIVHEMTGLAGKTDLRHFDRWFATTNKLRTEGTKNLLAAAEASGVPRFVAQSYTGWTNVADGSTANTEDDPFEPDLPAAQTETLAAIRFVEDAVTAAPQDGIVLRYGNFYGPGVWDAYLEQVRKRRFPLIGDGGGVWSWIHIDDAARATVAAVEGGQTGIFNVVDDEPAPVSVWLPYLAEALGAKPPLHVPVWIGRLMAGEVPVRWMTRSGGSSNAKAKRELGWSPEPSTWREGFLQALAETTGTA